MTHTQLALLSAAFRLAQRGELTAFDDERIAAEAGLTRAVLRREYRNEGDFWFALHKLHIQMLVQDISKAIENLPPGALRFYRGVSAFWDGCLRNLPIRQLVRQVQSDTATRARLDRINWAFAHMLSMEMKALGWARYNEAAQLAWFMADGVARLELETQGLLPELRQTFWEFMALPVSVWTGPAAVVDPAPVVPATTAAESPASPRGSRPRPGTPRRRKPPETAR